MNFASSLHKFTVKFGKFSKVLRKIANFPLWMIVAYVHSMTLSTVRCGRGWTRVKTMSMSSRRCPEFLSSYQTDAASLVDWPVSSPSSSTTPAQVCHQRLHHCRLEHRLHHKNSTKLELPSTDYRGQTDHVTIFANFNSNPNPWFWSMISIFGLRWFPANPSTCKKHGQRLGGSKGTVAQRQKDRQMDGRTWLNLRQYEAYFRACGLRLLV